MRDIFIEYLDKFESAERQIKRAEILFKSEIIPEDEGTFQGLIFPSVDQLRYAGFHAACAMRLQQNGNEESDVQKEIEKAINHCKRSIYDTNDAIIQFLIGECRQFQQDYRKIIVSAIVKGFIDDISKIDEVKSAISDKNRYEIPSEQLDGWIDQLTEIVKRWNSARNELNKVAYSNLRLFVLGCASLLISVLSAVFAALTYFKS